MELVLNVTTDHYKHYNLDYSDDSAVHCNNGSLL